jgi:predicted transposase/invertase (TIGR01784 family)
MNHTFNDLLASATGPIRYPLTNDYMFHAVFQESPASLKHLLSALLDIPFEEILSCELQNPIILGEHIDDKDCVLDIRLLLNGGRLINLEMQAGHFSTWPNRALFYLCRLYCNIKKGENYSAIKPALHIGILTNPPFPEVQEFYSEYLLTNTKNSHIFSSIFSLRVLDLSQINDVPEKNQDTQLYFWARLFTATTWEEIRMITEKNKNLTDAASYLRQLTEEEKIQLQCEARERYYMDMSSQRDDGMKEGIEIGREQGRNTLTQLMQRLLDENRIDDLKRSLSDPEFQAMLLKEYGLGG